MSQVRGKPMKPMISILVVCMIVISLIFTGCSTQGNKEQQNQNLIEIQQYTIGDSAGDWGFPSPWGHYQRGPGYIRMSLIFDTLIWKDDKGYIPALASNWKYDEETKSFNFILNEEMLWHDGHKITAEDVVFTFNYMKEHPYRWGDLESIQEVIAEGDTLVRIVLKKEYAPFLANVAATVPIIPKHIWGNIEEPEKYQERQALIGSGPFKFADYNKEQGTYLYEANPNYYQGKVNVNELRFIKLNPQMAAAALSKDEVDAVGIQPEMASQLKDKTKVISEKGSSQVKLMFNHQEEPFSEKDFRQAVAYAIDREELLAKAQRGHGQKGNPGMYASNNKWYNLEVNQYQVNLQETEQRMTKLGYKRENKNEGKTAYWTKNNQIVELELLCDADLSRTAEVLKEQLEKAGFKINIRSVESKTRDAKITAWDFDMALNMHGGLGGDPQLLNKFILADDFNSARYRQNTQLIELIQRQLSIMDEKKRIEVVAEIQKIYAEELPALTLYYPEYLWAYQGEISLYYTSEGMAIGIPLPLNKMSFVQKQ